MPSCSSPGPTSSTARIATSASTCPVSSGCSSRRSRRRKICASSRRGRTAGCAGRISPVTLGRFSAAGSRRRTLGGSCTRRTAISRTAMVSARPCAAVLRSTLEAGWRDGERVVLIGHSLGSVIAYDTLWELTHVQRAPGEVSLLVTLGSPLATRFVQRSLQGARELGAARYPHNIRRWVNMTARGDTTALHPRLKPLYHELLDLGLVEAIEDFVDFDNFFRGSPRAQRARVVRLSRPTLPRRNHRRLARTTTRSMIVGAARARASRAVIAGRIRAAAR